MPDIKKLRAKERLEAQLVLGTKRLRGKGDKFVPLTPRDIDRVKKEIKKLSTRI